MTTSYYRASKVSPSERLRLPVTFLLMTYLALCFFFDKYQLPCGFIHALMEPEENLLRLKKPLMRKTESSDSSGAVNTFIFFCFLTGV